MATAIIVAVLALAAVGIVIDRLLWLRKWLNKPASGPENHEDHEPH
jgi:hypothetical protein